jgi:hypothetical protein
MDPNQNRKDVTNEVLNNLKILDVEWKTQFEISFPFEDRVKKCYE